VSLSATLLPGRLVLQARSPQSVPFTAGVALPPPPAWKPGDLVQFRTRDLRPYYPAGTIFAKRVAGRGGDRLTRLGRDFYVNGRYAASAVATDSRGRPAPLFTPASTPAPLCQHPPLFLRACREPLLPRIPDGHLFVLGTHERSYDSRYWGLVDPGEIIGRVATLF